MLYFGSLSFNHKLQTKGNYELWTRNITFLTSSENGLFSSVRLEWMNEWTHKVFYRYLYKYVYFTCCKGLNSVVRWFWATGWSGCWLPPMYHLYLVMLQNCPILKTAHLPEEQAWDKIRTQTWTVLMSSLIFYNELRHHMFRWRNYHDLRNTWNVFIEFTCNLIRNLRKRSAPPPINHSLKL